MKMTMIDLAKLPKLKTDRLVLSFGDGNNSGTCVITCPDPENEADRFWFELRLVDLNGGGVQAQVYRDELPQLERLLIALSKSVQGAMQNEMTEWTFFGQASAPPRPMHTLDQLRVWVGIG